MTVLCSFDVIGIPRAQGSKRAFVVNGKARMTEAAGAAGANWRDAVATAARKEADEIQNGRGITSEIPPFDGPLQLAVTFYFPMPRSRKKADRDRGILPKTTAPDTSKLVRSLEDGLQAAGLIVDDARFYDISASKWERLGEWCGATVQIGRPG